MIMVKYEAYLHSPQKRLRPQVKIKPFWTAMSRFNTYCILEILFLRTCEILRIEFIV